jgi:NAD(P)-dependent dehydrogenase (short-subunit alcohol dehydrogenase family)
MSDPFNLKNKTILVTGASSGIGWQTCLFIHRQGGNFIAISRRQNLLKELVDLTSSKNKFVAADLTKPEEIEMVVHTIDKIDGIVHCAGIVSLAPVKFYTRKIMDEIRNINYDSILLMVNLIFKKKKINKNSSIVLVSSLAGIFGMKANGIYAGTKGALIAISKVWANEFSNMNIRVNCVSPGMVKTDITINAINDLSKETIEEDEKKYPLGYGNSEDVANPIIFLLSNGSKWITGQNFVLDGGRSIVI